MIMRLGESKYCVGEVTISKNKNSIKKEEEQEMFCADAVYECLPTVNRILTRQIANKKDGVLWNSTNVFLLTLSQVCRAVSGRRNEGLETRTGAYFLRHYGVWA